MTPKEKAKELILKYGYVIRNAEDQDGFLTNVNHAKDCALIAVDELIKEEILWLEEVGGGEEQFWEQVKQELENL